MQSVDEKGANRCVPVFVAYCPPALRRLAPGQSLIVDGRALSSRSWFSKSWEDAAPTASKRSANAATPSPEALTGTRDRQTLEQAEGRQLASGWSQNG